MTMTTLCMQDFNPHATLADALPIVTIRDASIIRDSVNRYADDQGLTDPVQRTKARLYGIALRKQGWQLHAAIREAQTVVDAAVRLAAQGGAA